MDTIVTMQKIFRLRALVHDSSLSHDDAFVKSMKEPRSVVQPPAMELTPQDIRVSSSWASHSKLTHSTSEKLLHPAIIPVPKTFLRSLLNPSRRQTLASSSKGEGQAEKDDTSTRKREQRERACSVTGTASSGPTAHQTIRSQRDPFLPRLDPPPLLKSVKHVRNRSHNNALPDQTIPAQSSTCRYGSFAFPSKSGSSLEVQTLGISNEDWKTAPAGARCSLTQATTRSTTAFEASDNTEPAFRRPDYDWQPPTSWAGPSKAASADEDDSPTPVGWFTKRKSNDGANGGSMRIRTRLNRARSFKRLKPVQTGATEFPEKGDFAVHGGLLSPGAVVEIQCYEGDGWHEKSMADVIPKLRGLKSK